MLFNGIHVLRLYNSRQINTVNHPNQRTPNNHLDQTDHLDDRRSGRKVGTLGGLNPGIFRTSQTFIKLEVTDFTRKINV